MNLVQYKMSGQCSSDCVQWASLHDDIVACGDISNVATGFVNYKNIIDMTRRYIAVEKFG